jgi:pimeloyl-ACP methyl ester carboxylesterase
MQPGLARVVRFPGCGHGILRDDAAGLVEAVRRELLGVPTA